MKKKKSQNTKIKKKSKYKRKDTFERVNKILSNPIRTDIVQELSQTPQRPIDLADNIGVDKYNINYHLNELKKTGLVRSHQKAIPTNQINDVTIIPRTGEKVEKTAEELGNISLRGQRINGIDDDGNLRVTYGVELTEEGKAIANEFVNKLYIDSDQKIDSKEEPEK